MNWTLDLGANIIEKGKVAFKIWAPLQNNLQLKIWNKDFPLPINMQKDSQGYFFCVLDNVNEGDIYFYITDKGELRPDPVSRYLPKSVHGPSMIIDHDSFKWSDHQWSGIDLEELIFYECHIGTFTEEGTFEGAIKKIPYLQQLGINCLEIMPVAQFPGKWNWGYDGASAFAVQNSYGGPNGLKKLVDALHAAGIAACLDVVYNHSGPEGTYLGEFGPYFSEKYKNPWGNAPNVDDAYSDHVRYYFIQNALYWINEYHFDVLRLDAVHGIYDLSAYPFLAELNDSILKHRQRKIFLVAESDLNDSRLVRDKNQGGCGLACSWSDDFHHSLHVTLTGDQEKYYIDFNGLNDLATAYTKSYIYDGKYSKYRKRSHGNKCADLSPKHFLVCLQNHDQIGNQVDGIRLTQQVSFGALKVAACAFLLSPYIPLIFMGQEYHETHPFHYFVDFEDQKLQAAVLKSKQKEFQKEEIHIGERAFLESKLSWKKDKHHLAMLDLYKDLIAIRKNHLIKQEDKKIHVYFSLEQNWVAWEYLTKDENWLGIICHFAEHTHEICLPFKELLSGKLLLSTEEKKYLGQNHLILQKHKLILPAESACILM